MDDCDFTFKILIIGEPSVGKTAIMERFCDGVFHEDLISTIGVDFNTKVVTVGNTRIKLQLWDTAGQERFKNVTTSYYRGTQGCLVVYDVTKKESFEKVTHWIKEYETEQEISYIIVVGNKIDLDDEVVVDEQEALAFAKQQNYKAALCSAKTGQNVDQIFQMLAQGIFENKAIMDNLPKKNTINVVKPADDKCC